MCGGCFLACLNVLFLFISCLPALGLFVSCLHAGILFYCPMPLLEQVLYLRAPPPWHESVASPLTVYTTS